MPSSGWANSNRKHELPADWHRTRRRILNRDKTCTCPGCPLHPALCHAASTDVDHIGDRHNHDDTNLRGLCSPCHDQRSSQQGLQARGHGPLRQRPPEQHPGLLTTPGG